MDAANFKNVAIIKLEDYERLRKNSDVLNDFLNDRDSVIKAELTYNTEFAQVKCISKVEFEGSTNELLLKEIGQVNMLEKILCEIGTMSIIQIFKLLFKYTRQQYGFLHFIKSEYKDLI